jgi:hypothetical protein
LTELRDYQVADLAFYMTQPRVLNTSDPGTGKTPSACAYSYYHTTLGHRFVWVQPRSIIRKNHEEMLRFTPLTANQIAIVDGTKAQKEAAINSSALGFFMTAQSLTTYGSTLKRLYPNIQLVVTDEHHMMYGGHTSQRTQGLYAFMRGTKHFLGMSGTLINGKYDTVYPAIHLIEPRYYGSYEAFKQYHHITDDYGGFIGYQRPEKITAILARHSIRRTFQEIYGKENKVLIVENVEMSPQQRRSYDLMHKEAMLELDDKFIDGTLPGVNVIRARQIMAHPENVAGSVITRETTGKDERLLIHLEDHQRNNKPLVVFASLVPEQERIKTLIERTTSKPCGLLNGAASSTERNRIDTEFRAGRLQYMVVSPATASVGYNWQMWGTTEVDHIMFASLDYMDSSLVQAYRRMIRGVRKTPLRVTILAYERSIDQRIFHIVEEKSKLAESVDATRETVSIVSRKSVGRPEFSGPPTISW